MSKNPITDDSLWNERLITAAISFVVAVLWALDQLSFFAFIIIVSITIILMIQLDMRRKMQAMRNREEERLRDTSPTPATSLRNVRAVALQNLPTPILLVDRSHQVVLANQAAHDLLGSDIDGQDVFLFLRQSNIIDAVQGAIRGQPVRDHENLRFETSDERSFDITIDAVETDFGDVERVKNRQAMIFFFEVTSMLRAEKMRVDFVANASHELRTPLSTVMGSIETLQGPAADDPEGQKRFLSIMQRESERMVRLIDDLLSLSRIEMSRHKMPSKPVDILMLFENAIVLQKDAAAKRDIEFNLRVNKGLPMVRADEDQIMQVMINLLHNATKYATEGTTVTLEAVHEPDYGDISITVSDQGPGIAPEHLGRLTERFYRIDNARSRKMGGTGLGLAIVKHILLRHKSNLEIKSQLGAGTQFAFRLSVYQQDELISTYQI